MRESLHAIWLNLIDILENDKTKGKEIDLEMKTGGDYKVHGEIILIMKHSEYWMWQWLHDLCIKIYRT